jgi:16S rRNA (cytidine1402-2'-O)-methyltransferase
VEPETTHEIAGQGRPGTLYVVSTPIGNLEDITLRALRVLKEVDLIAAESVDHTRALCRHFGIETKLTGYNQHNQGVKGPGLIRRLQGGASVALVTNAGTPGVSDPGVLLARQAGEAGIPISAVPGPSAVTAALSVSGMRGERFVFAGFLSNRPGKRRAELKELVSEKRTLIFFEAPHRIEEMLRDLLDILGNRSMVLLREISKIHEEVIHGRADSVMKALEGRVRGEFTVVVEGGKDDGAESIVDERVKKTIVKLMSKNIMSVKDIAQVIAEGEGVPWRKIYRACLAIQREEEPSTPGVPEERR